MKQVRDNKLLSKIALVLKDLRAIKNVSQLEVYNDTNINIARMETAKVNVTVSSISILCSYFGISIQEFFRLVGQK